MRRDHQYTEHEGENGKKIIINGRKTIIFYFSIMCQSYNKRDENFDSIYQFFFSVDERNFDFRCIFVNKNIVSSFFPSKDQIPLMMSSNIIYKYSCGQCQSSYIGETHRHFISRICEHKGISPRTKKPYVNPPHSNIREHSLSCDHPICKFLSSVLL